MDGYQRLSESFLWDYQHQYFNQAGIAAWQTVPYYVTSNPLIAKSFAKVILGYLRDILSPENSHSIDFNLPIYIVELGAGTGRFSFYFLKHFFEQNHLPLFQKIKIVYVITDIVSENVKYCLNKNCFANDIEAGRLDFAVFDMIDDKSINLIKNNIKISKNSNNNPLIFISNYIFDGMRNDLFMIDNNILSAAHIDLNINKTAALKDFCSVEELFKKNQLSFRFDPIVKNYYSIASWNTILSLYERQKVQGSFLFPVDALIAINNLYDLANNTCLILAADRGHSALKESLSSGLSKIGSHGCFSLDVNFYVLEQFVKLNNGIVKQIKRYENGINFAMFIVDKKSMAFPETLQSFNDYIIHFNSYDFLKIKKLMERIGDMATLDEILAMIQLSHWDQKIFAIILEPLKLKLSQLDNYHKCKLRLTLDSLYEWFYFAEDEAELLGELTNLQNNLSV